MSRVTVIFVDDVIVVDGNAATFDHDEVESTNTNYVTLQWYGDEDKPYGTIEVKKGERIWFTDPKIVQPYIDQHAPRFAQLEAERIERIETAARIEAEARQSILDAEAEAAAAKEQEEKANE